MTDIIFIRHAPTKPDKTQHSTQWQLSEDSQKLCYQLAEQIKHHNITKIYTSIEPKAQLTGKFIAEKLEITSIASEDNLQETERHSKAFYDNQNTFRLAVQEAMLFPNNLIFGDETFTDARIRFTSQVEQLANKHPDETIVIVTHGRILSMYLGDIMKQSPETIWKKLQMPAYAILSWEKQEITDIQYTIEASISIDIYDAQIEDIPEIRTLIEATLQNRHSADEVKRLMKRVYSAESFQKTLASENRHLIVAIIEESIVGLCQYGIPLMDDCDCEDLRSIQTLFVHPDADHDNIASALVYDVEESVDEVAGVQRLSIFVNSEWMTLIKFYARLGFIHDQVEDVDGEWYMEKDL